MTEIIYGHLTMHSSSITNKTEVFVDNLYSVHCTGRHSQLRSIQLNLNYFRPQKGNQRILIIMSENLKAFGFDVDTLISLKCCEDSAASQPHSAHIAHTKREMCCV